MIVVNAVKLTGITKTNQIFKQTLTAGLIAAVALIFIYISLGYIGNHMPVSDMTLDQLKSKDRNIGTYLLTTWLQQDLVHSENIYWASLWRWHV